MSKYGDAAVQATLMVKTGACRSPVEAWDAAVRRAFPASEASRKKNCPKGAYLGLCEAGLVKGVGRGGYTRSSDNKRYAIRAVELLQRNPERAADADARSAAARLWLEVMNGESKKSNGQMEVVLALWRADLVERGS